MQRRLELGGEHVDLGLGEVGQAAGVVEVEVGGDDVADVAGGEAERLELRQRRRLDSRPRPHQRPKTGPSWRGLRASVDAEAGVDEDQPVVGLDRQAVADDVGRAPAARPRR